MEWLTYEDAVKVLPPIQMGLSAPQMISLVADVMRLSNDIPITSVLIPSQYGPPGPVKRWSGITGDRFFTLECEAGDFPHQSALIRTGFLGRQDELGDWSTLLEFQELPKSLYTNRPLFIESRNLNPKCVVYRPDPQGWRTAVYKAATRLEAEALLAFMKKDTWNAECFVGEPSPAGKWAVVQGERVMSGTGSELNEALRFACNWSLRYGLSELLVKDVSGFSQHIFVVGQGRVLRRSDS